MSTDDLNACQEPMQGRYRISERDYVRASLRAGSVLRALVIMFVSIACLIILNMKQNWPDLVLAFTGSGVICMFVFTIWIVMRYLVAPWQMSRRYRRYKTMQGEFTVSLLAEGVRITSENGESRLLWKNIFKWRMNEEFILIYPLPGMVHIIPASVAGPGFDLQQFKSKLTERLGPAK